MKDRLINRHNFNTDYVISNPWQSKRSERRQHRRIAPKIKGVNEVSMFECSRAYLGLENRDSLRRKIRCSLSGDRLCSHTKWIRAETLLFRGEYIQTDDCVKCPGYRRVIDIVGTIVS